MYFFKFSTTFLEIPLEVRLSFVSHLENKYNLIGQSKVRLIVITQMNWFAFAYTAWINPFSCVVKWSRNILAHRSKYCLYARWHRSCNAQHFINVWQKYSVLLLFWLCDPSPNEWMKLNNRQICTHQSDRRLKSKPLGTPVAYQLKLIAFFRLNSRESYRPSYHEAWWFNRSKIHATISGD